MRRRILDLCLLAYPRDRRERDRDYLRDLALELAETYGLRRQAVSLVRGGLSERVSDTDACAQAKRQVAAHRQGGWECAMRWRARDGQRAATWRCTL